MKKGMCILHKIAAGLLVIGGINWGLVGIGGFVGSDWNLVHMLLGSWPMVEWVVYILVGLSALAMIAACKCCMGCKGCANGKCEMQGGKCQGGKCSGMKEGGSSCKGMMGK